MTSHPPPPWTLRGDAIAVPLFLPRRRVVISPPLSAAVPGPRVPAVVVAARYGPGSSLVYDELAVLVCVRHGARLGVQIVGLWVDGPASVEGGRSIWGLAKELARFEWADEAGAVGVAIHADGEPLARFRARPLGPAIPLPFPLALRVFQVRAGRVESFRVRLRARVRAAVVSPATGAESRGGGVLAGARVGPGFAFERLDARVFPPGPA